jgi:fibronectin-binding autotransporter adhesin
MTRSKWFAVLLAVVLVLTLFVNAGAQTFYTTMDNVIMRSLIVTGTSAISGATTVGTLDVTGAATVGSTLNVTGASTLTGATNMVGNASATGTLAVNGARLSVAKYLSTALQGAITVTEGSVITPTGTLQEITAAGAVTASLSPAVNGDIVILLNSSANNITIADTTGQILASNAVLGQGDTLTLVGTTGAWYEVGRSNN